MFRKRDSAKKPLVSTTSKESSEIEKVFYLEKNAQIEKSEIEQELAVLICQRLRDRDLFPFSGCLFANQILRPPRQFRSLRKRRSFPYQVTQNDLEIANQAANLIRPNSEKNKAKSKPYNMLPTCNLLKTQKR
jgi:hypothetical protein